jgi:hypothetical protein
LTHVSVKSEISMECWHFGGGMGPLDFCLLEQFDKAEESLAACYKE